MHAPKYLLASLVLSALHGCMTSGLPPENYGITVVISSQPRDAGAPLAIK